MKVLILSCNTGQGHNSAATAVKDELVKMGHECVMKDALSYASKMFSKGISNSYNSIVLHAPQAFGVGYRYCKSKSYTPGSVKSASYAINMTYSKKLCEEIIEDGYDAVLCTHVFAAQSITHIKHKHGLKIPAYVIATDYSYCPYFDELDMDKYFISLESVKKEYIGRGIPADKIVVTGIPVSSRFSMEISKHEAREKIGFYSDRFLCLIMSGSMGFGNIYDFIDEVLNRPMKDYDILVIAGNNEKLRSGIIEKYEKYGNVTAIGYTKEVHNYMKASDLIVTKPGGLSSTEAMVSNVPLVLANPIPGVESENYDVLTRLGVAIGGNKAIDAANAFEAIFNDSIVGYQVINNQKKYINGNAAQEICKHVVKGVGTANNE